MDELLKTLDESVFTPELTSKIQELYESKIGTVVSEYESKLQEAEEAAESKIQEIEAKATEYADMVKETYETKATEYADYVKEELETKATEYADYVKEELTKTVTSYLDIVVEEFVEENKVAIDQSVQVAKMKAVLEGFDSLLVTSGVALSQIVEAKNEASPVAELESTKSTINKLVKENADLKVKISEMAKQSALDSFSASMSLVQKDRFDKLAEMAVYTGSMDEYTNKLQTIVETIVATPAQVVTKKETLIESFENKADDKSEALSHKRFF
jgi:hypothetical protein